MSAGLRAFLERLRHSPEAPAHDHALLERYGGELVGFLQQERLLVPAGEADWYPCPGAGEGCPRVAHRDSFPGKPKPHHALCGTGSGCLNITLSDADLQLSRLDLGAFLGFLQGLLGLPRLPARPEPSRRKAWGLGRQRSGALEREVVLDLSPDGDSLALTLLERRTRLERALVLLPARDRVPAELVVTHGPGAPVELAFLEDRLRLEGGELRYEAPASQAASQPAYCHALEDGQARELSRESYAELVSRAQEYHLFLDLTAPGGRVRAGRKEGEVFEDVDLSQPEAEALAALMLAGKPVRASALRPGRGDHFKFLSRARQKVDVPEGRYRWRFFQTRSGESKEAHEFEFRPEPTWRYLLLYAQPPKGRR